MTDLADSRTLDERLGGASRYQPPPEKQICANCDREVSFTYDGRCRVCDMLLHPKRYQDD